MDWRLVEVENTPVSLLRHFDTVSLIEAYTLGQKVVQTLIQTDNEEAAYLTIDHFGCDVSIGINERLDEAAARVLASAIDTSTYSYKPSGTEQLEAILKRSNDK